MKKKSVKLTSRDVTKKDLDSAVKRLDEKLDSNAKFLKNEIDVAFDFLKHEFKMLPTRDEFDDLKQKINLLPSKDEFFTAMDKLIGELQTIRDESIILNGRTSEHTDMLENHEERITKLELPHASI